MRDTQHTTPRAARELARSGQAGRGSTIDGILHLQSTAGNTAVTGLLAPKQQAHGIVVQRFEEREHRAIGNAATGQQRIDLAPGLPVTYGDMVALGGDYFGDWQTITRLAHAQGITEGTRGEIWYAVLVEIRGEPEQRWLGKAFDAKAKAAVKQRFRELAARNVPHFPNPRAGDRNRSQAAKDSGPHAIGAGATYRQNHATALTVAAAAGQAGRSSLNEALMIEGFSDHFLTDAFSAGHQQTERADIKAYWHAKMPMFWFNFQEWLAEKLAVVIHERAKSAKVFADRIPGIVSADKVKKAGTLPALHAAMRSLPPVSFGEIISGAIHDYFNSRGAQAVVGGRRIELVGDNRLLESSREQVTDRGRDTFNAAIAAVKAGIAEVHHAHHLGKQGEDPTRVPDEILAAGRGTFAAEALLPTLVPDANVVDDRQRSIDWKSKSAADILKDPKIGFGLLLGMHKYANQILGALPDLDPDIKHAVQTVLIDRMTSGHIDMIIKLFQEIIDYTPSLAGGFLSDSADTNALAYVEQARQQGGLWVLSLTQRQHLVRDLVSEDWEASDGARAILDLLEVRPAEAPSVIAAVGWAAVWNRLDGRSRVHLIAHFGSAYWSTQRFGAKLVELRRLVAEKGHAAVDTALVVLRTCTQGELQQVHHDLHSPLAALFGTRRTDLKAALGP